MEPLLKGRVKNQTTIELEQQVHEPEGTAVLVLPPLTEKLQLTNVLGLLRLSNVVTLVVGVAGALAAAFWVGHAWAKLERAPKEPTPQPMLSDLLSANGGRYEWQWAAENWDGEITFSPIGEGAFEVKAALDRLRKDFSKGNGVFKTDKLAVTTRAGTVVPARTAPHFAIRGLELRFEEFAGRAGGQQVMLTTSDLRPVAAFVGTVEYQLAGRVEKGRIVLVNDRWKL